MTVPYKDAKPGQIVVFSGEKARWVVMDKIAPYNKEGDAHFCFIEGKPAETHWRHPPPNHPVDIQDA